MPNIFVFHLCPLQFKPGFWSVLHGVPVAREPVTAARPASDLANLQHFFRNPTFDEEKWTAGVSPPVMTNIAIEHGLIENIVRFPMKNRDAP